MTEPKKFTSSGSYSVPTPAKTTHIHVMAWDRKTRQVQSKTLPVRPPDDPAPEPADILADGEEIEAK